MFKEINNTENKKGISLFLITIMLAVLLGFSLNVATIIIGAAKITLNVANSVKAFHCADSGIEYALYGVATGVLQCPAARNPISGNLSGGGSYSFTIYNQYNNCGTGTEIESSGTYPATATGATRKIKINY